MISFENIDCFEKMKGMEDNSIPLIITDPFAGSVSSGVAAEVNKRQYIGCELDKDMYEKAKNWLLNIDYELAGEYVNHRMKSTQMKLF